MNYYIVTFQKGCNSCMNTTGITQMINVNGYDEILDFSFNEDVTDNEVKRLIKRFYRSTQQACELCGIKNNFDFYDIEVNGKKVIETDYEIQSEEDFIFSGNRFFFKFEKFSFISGELNTEKEIIENIEIEETNKGGLLEINESYIKIFDVFRKQHMKELFHGNELSFTFSTYGGVELISGKTISYRDGRQIGFKLEIDKYSLGDWVFAGKQKNNCYLSVEPKILGGKYVSNILLMDIYEKGIIE